MSIEAKMDRLWKETYPHRNPHQWSDESQILASVMDRELAKMREKLAGLEKAARKDVA